MVWINKIIVYENEEDDEEEFERKEIRESFVAYFHTQRHRLLPHLSPTIPKSGLSLSAHPNQGGLAVRNLNTLPRATSSHVILRYVRPTCGVPKLMTGLIVII